MRLLTLFFLLIGMLFSCNSSKNLVDTISSIEIEVDKNETVNVGSSFAYTLYAHLNSGEKRKIKDDGIVFLEDSMFADAGKHRAKVVRPLPNFEDSIFPISIKISIGKYSFLGTDSIKMNFKGPILLDWSSADGTDGTQPRASAATLFSRDGLEGRPGENGEDGASGRNVSSHLWMEGNELRMVLTCDRCSEHYYFRSISKDSVLIDLSGGDGGDGSRGGTGGDGKPGKAGKLPGNGADGGAGGKGGNGGDGGSLVLFIHPNAAHMNKSVTLINNGGKAGELGEGGKAGGPGKALKNQQEGISGNEGKDGASGKPGTNGPPATISIVAFDPESLNNQE